jgi:hypothetical protein
MTRCPRLLFLIQIAPYTCGSVTSVGCNRDKWTILVPKRMTNITSKLDEPIHYLDEIRGLDLVLEHQTTHM